MKVSNPLNFFIGKTVLVEVRGECAVYGVLKCYELGYRKGHLPTVLILQNENRFTILRAWSLIKEVSQ
jgi:hypothetical protein